MKKEVVLVGLMAVLLGIVFFGCQSAELTSAKLYIQQNNLEKAEEQFLLALQAEPTNSEVPFLLGYQVYYEKQQWDKMNEMFDKSLAIDNRFAEQIKAIRGKAAGEELNKGAKIFNMAVTEQDQFAREALIEKAMVNFEEAKKIDPKSIPIRSAIIKSYKLLNDTLKFEQELDEALQIAPDNEELMVFKAENMLDKGNYEDARDYLESVIARDPENTRAYYLIAESYVQQGEVQSALDTYMRLYEKNRNDPDILYNIGMLYLEDLQDFEEAEFYFQKLLDINPDDVEVIARLAEAYTKIENWGMAEEYYRRLVELLPDNKAVWQNLYIVVYRQGRVDEALELKKKADSLP